MEREEVFWAGLLAASMASIVLVFGGHPYTSLILFLIALALYARFALMLVRRRFTVDLLMATAIAVAAIEKLYLEAALIAVLYGVAELVEHGVEEFARRRISSLRSLLPRRVRVERDGRIASIDPTDVRPGDRVVVGVGETVPVDGVLSSEEGVFDASLVTGEPYPVRVRRGEVVESGYINIGDTPVVVEALRGPGESLLYVLVREAEKALEEKTGTARLVEKIAPYYTLAVLGVYTAVSLAHGPVAGLPLLLAGCPSAFIIVSSFSSAYAIGLLASRGVLVRGGGVLERLAGVRVVVLDKTGTLTRPAGKAKIVAGAGNGILGYIVAAAALSRHPLSRAIVEAYAPRVGVIPAAERATETPGGGVEAIVAGRRVVLGSKQFVEERLGVKVVGDGGCREGAVVYAGVEGAGAVAICVEEDVDEASVEELRRVLRGAYLVIASGDRSRERVEKVAVMIGASEAYSSLSPGEKAGLVKRLRASRGPVAMVGDGVNDAWALAEADVGIAVGGVDAVSSVADAVVADARGLAALFDMAKRYRIALAAGFTVAGALKAVAIALGFAQAVPLWLVLAIGDDGATLAGTAAALAVLAGVPQVSRRRTGGGPGGRHSNTTPSPEPLPGGDSCAGSVCAQRC